MKFCSTFARYPFFPTSFKVAYLCCIWIEFYIYIYICVFMYLCIFKMVYFIYFKNLYLFGQYLKHKVEKAWTIKEKLFGV